MPLPIPAYPDMRPLQLDDRDLFRNIFAVLQPQISEFTFANLFLFRQVHRYTVTLVDESLVVFGCGYDAAPYFLPPLTGN